MNSLETNKTTIYDILKSKQSSSYDRYGILIIGIMVCFLLFKYFKKQRNQFKNNFTY